MRAGQSKRSHMQWLGLVGVALALLCWTPSSLAEALPARQKQLFDHAALLSVPAAERIAGRLADARSQGRDLVVLTVDSLEGEPAERYARRLVRRLGVGSDLAMGALLLIAERQRRIWIEPAATAPGVAQAVSFRSIGQGLIARAFGAGRYDAGIEQGVEALLDTPWPRAPVAARFEPDATMAVEATMARQLLDETSQPELGELFGPGLLAFVAAVAGFPGPVIGRGARAVLRARRTRPDRRPETRRLEPSPHQSGAIGPWVA
jgi:uncharacterized membrane protein YgcG